MHTRRGRIGWGGWLLPKLEVEGVSLSVAASPSTAPENIDIFPPTSFDIDASLAVTPRIRSVSSNDS